MTILDKKQSLNYPNRQSNINKMNLAIATPTDCARWRGKFKENLGKILDSIEQVSDEIFCQIKKEENLSLKMMIFQN